MLFVTSGGEKTAMMACKIHHKISVSIFWVSALDEADEIVYMYFRKVEQVDTFVHFLLDAFDQFFSLSTVRIMYQSILITVSLSGWDFV